MRTTKKALEKVQGFPEVDTLKIKHKVFGKSQLPHAGSIEVDV